MDLLAQIIANPDDRELRRVYADELARRGDPRGEFILLQLAAGDGALEAAGRKRMRVLERRHARRWLGELAAVASDAIFEDGFLARCTLGVAPPPTSWSGALARRATIEATWAAALASERRIELATVRDLVLADAVPEPSARALLTETFLPSLRSLSVDATIAGAVGRSVDVLEMRFGAAPAELPRAQPRWAPRELHCVIGGEHYPRLLAALLVVFAGKPVGPVERVVARTVTASMMRYEVAIEPGADGKLSVIDARGRSGVLLPDVLHLLAPEAITCVRVGDLLATSERAALAQACARFGSDIVRDRATRPSDAELRGRR